MPETTSPIPDSFDHQKPLGISVETIKKIRTAAKSLRDLLNESIEPCREYAVSIIKLEECVMWANKAVVFTQQPTPCDACNESPTGHCDEHPGVKPEPAK
jgi:hypothetical protein